MKSSQPRIYCWWHIICNILSFISTCKTDSYKHLHLSVAKSARKLYDLFAPNTIFPYSFPIGVNKYGKQLWNLRWKQNIHAELSTVYLWGLLICAVTPVLGKSRFSMQCNCVSTSQTPGAFLQLIHTLLGSLSFSIGLHSRQDEILKK